MIQNRNRSMGPSRRFHRIVGVLSVIVLIPCAFGFGTKFLEFIATYRQETDGSFVLLPMFNYLFATIGFGFLLVWATFHGMFRDWEGPKYAFLERERYLDHLAEEGDPPTASDDGPTDRPSGPTLTPRRRATRRQFEEALIHG